MKIILITIYILLCIADQGITQTYLIPYRENDRWGYADTNGVVIVEPRYDKVNFFFSGYAQVAKGTLKGVINAKGQEIIPVAYDEISTPYRGYAAVGRDGRSGMISLGNGKLILPVQYKNIRQITTYHFIVADANGQQGIFNAKTKKWDLQLSYDVVDYKGSRDGDEWLVATKKRDSTVFAINEKDGLRRKNQFPAAPAVPVIEAGNDDIPPEVEKIETTGAPAITTSYSWPVNVNGKQGWVSWLKWDGKLVKYDSIPAVYDTIYRAFANDSLFIVGKNTQKGIVNLKNEIIFPLQYEDVQAVDSSVSHGIYILKSGGKYGLGTVDTMLLPFEYDAIAWVSHDTRGFVLNKNGKSGIYVYDNRRKIFHVLIVAVYDYLLGISAVRAADFDPSVPYDFTTEEGFRYLLYVSKNGKRGYVDMDGREYFK